MEQGALLEPTAVSAMSPRMPRAVSPRCEANGKSQELTVPDYVVALMALPVYAAVMMSYQQDFLTSVVSWAALVSMMAFVCERYSVFLGLHGDEFCVFFFGLHGDEGLPHDSPKLTGSF